MASAGSRPNSDWTKFGKRRESASWSGRLTPSSRSDDGEGRDISSEISAGGRFVRLMIHGWMPSEHRVWIDQQATFDDVSTELATINSPGEFVVLQPSWGPKPRWSKATPESPVGRTCQIIHAVFNHQPGRCIMGVVRTSRSDYPIAIFESELTSSKTFSQAIESYPDLAGKVMSITRYSDDKDVSEDQISYEELANYSSSTFSTFIVITIDQPKDEFKSDPPYQPVPTFLQSPFTHCTHLLKRSYDLKYFALQMIHLSHAILHIIISLADQLEPIVNKENPDIEAALAADDEIADVLRIAPLLSRDIQGVLDLENETIDIIESMSFDRERVRRAILNVFDSICGEYPGAVTVRHSHKRFETLALIDEEEDEVNRARNVPEATTAVSDVRTAASSEAKLIPETDRIITDVRWVTEGVVGGSNHDTNMEFSYEEPVTARERRIPTSMEVSVSTPVAFDSTGSAWSTMMHTPAMSQEEKRTSAGEGICILSLDNGGPGTYSQLLLLKEYTSRLANDLGVEEEDVYPADYFDLMGGVGFGGLVAIMLGHLRMNVDEAIGALTGVATTAFAEDSQGTVYPEANSMNLKEAIGGMLHTKEVPLNTKMYERDRPQTRCKVVLYAATLNNLSHLQAFRTYSHRGASLNPTIVEAVCATMAIPSYFLSIKIGRRQDRFVGGAIGAHNPSCELLKEASTVFGNDRRVAQIISLGCGVPSALSLESMTKESGVGRSLKEITADCQMVAKELAARLYSVDIYLRLSVEKGIGTIDMDQWGMLGDVETHTAYYTETEVVANALESSLECLKRRNGAITLAHLNQLSSGRITKVPPPVSPYFVRRVKEWEKLVWHLVTSPCSWQKILPITGMGGCGKTQLVLYFLQEYPSLFKHVAYVDASTLSSIKADLQAWARTLGDGHERDVWEDAIRILSSPSEEERLGLILDNADDPTLNIVPFIPKSIDLTIIITSRNRDLGNLSTTDHIELGEMEPDEALATLLHAARRQLPLSTEELKSAYTLLKELGSLAVALVQAGTYCYAFSSHELAYSFTQYLSLFKSHRVELMKMAPCSSLDSYERGAYATFDLSYTALPQVARSFLHFISFFHHTGISLTALATAAECGFEDLGTLFPRPDAHKHVVIDLKRLLCADGDWDEMRVQETLRTLCSFSLLSITSIGEAVFLQLHPLIQSWARDMDPSASQHYRLMATQIITSCSKVEDFQLHRHLIPHILEMLDQLKGKGFHMHDIMAAGKILQEQGQYAAAAGVFETALEAIVKNTEPMKENIVSGQLATVYRLQGRWSQAEKLEVGVLEQCKKILGAEHPDKITAATNLASTYHAQGRWGEAEKLGVEALEKRRVMEHPDAIMAAANLAGTYREQGRLNEAEKRGLEVLERRRKILGIEHPDTTQAAGNLALTYQAQGRWSEAETVQVEVLEQQKRILGMEHPYTIQTVGNLASTYYGQGRWSEAEKLGLEVLEQHRRVLGVEHPGTIRAAGNLAITYQAQGRWSEAEKVQVEVLEQRSRIQGMEHPETIRTAANLAVTYATQGRWEESVALLAATVQLSLKVLGQRHAHTQITLRNLVTVYRKLGKEKEAQHTQALLIS